MNLDSWIAMSGHSAVEIASKSPAQLNAFALVDASAFSLKSVSSEVFPIIDTQSTAGDAAGPVLIDLSRSKDLPKALGDAINDPTTSWAVMAICSTYSARELAKHFRDWAIAEDYEQQAWGLAFWDAGVFASLVGANDDTQFVRGPVFNREQCATFFSPIAAWLYADRSGKWRLLDADQFERDPTANIPFPIKLTYAQLEQLSIVNIPDRLTQLILGIDAQACISISPLKLYATCVEAARGAEATISTDLAALAIQVLDRIEADATHKAAT